MGGGLLWGWVVDVCVEGEVFVCYMGEDEGFDFVGGFLWCVVVEGGVVDWLFEVGDDVDDFGFFGCVVCLGNVLEVV